MKTPLYCLLPSFSNFVQTYPHPPPLSVSPLTPTSTALSGVLFLWLNGWSCHIWCTILLNDIDPDVCFMQQGIKFTEAWHTWIFAGTLIWYHTNTHTHTHKDTEHTQGPVDWHTHIYIYITYYVLTTAIFITLNNSLISKFYFPQCLFFSKTIQL